MFFDVHCYIDLGGRVNISKSVADHHLVTVSQKGEYTMMRSQVHGREFGGVRMRRPMSKERNYFEVTLLETVGVGEIGIGIGHEKYILSDMPGWEDGSIGYHADDGGLFHEQGFAKLHGPRCVQGDKMGCGVNFTHSENGYVHVWFTKNGETVIKPQVFELPATSARNIYPLIGMRASGQEVQYMGYCQKEPPTDGEPATIM